MKFYVILIHGEDTPNIATFDDKVKAEASFFKKRATALNTETNAPTQLLFLNSENGIHDKWIGGKVSEESSDDGNIKGYVFEAANGDSKIKGTSVYAYDDVVSAEADFCQKYGTALDSELYTSEQIMFFDSNNDIKESKVFTR